MAKQKPKLGQNFLVDEHASQRIVEALGPLERRTVVEIGPGHGAITSLLAPRCARLHCVEFDPSLVRELQFRFREQPHVTIHHADVLQFSFTGVEEQALTEAGSDGSVPPLDVVGNLPYYITSDILLHLYAAARQKLLRRAVVMMQREVADRIVASPGASEYGALSAFTQLHAHVARLFTLPPSAFRPQPEVFSTVLRLEFAPRFDELGVEPESFNRFLRASFAQKRKTLANNLRAAGYTAAAIEQAWPGDVARLARSEEIPLDTMAALYRRLEHARESD